MNSAYRWWQVSHGTHVRQDINWQLVVAPLEGALADVRLWETNRSTHVGKVAALKINLYTERAV